MSKKEQIIEAILEKYNEARWKKEEIDVEALVSEYPEYADEIHEAIEDYEFALAAKGLDKVIEVSKSAKEIWEELLPRLRAGFAKKASQASC